MGKSLLVSQLLRLLKNGDSKSLAHVGLWVGDLLCILLPQLKQGFHPRQVPIYFGTLADHVAQALVEDVVSENSWRNITNKILYRHHERSFPVPKIEIESVISYTNIWRRLNFTCVSSDNRDLLYLLIHNKLPVTERLFRINLHNDPYCNHCLNDLGAVMADSEHFFCMCLLVVDVWREIKNIIVSLFPVHQQVHLDASLISLDFPRNRREKEVTWILSNYVNYVWNMFNAKGAHKLCKEKVFGFLKYKYRSSMQNLKIPKFEA